MRYQWISFTTDYGLADGFVAACHGVIARIAPEARMLDVTHQVAPQQIRHGAVALAQTVRYLPESVHLAVVDPGVGTRRRGVVVVAECGLLVGPDNGLLLPAASELGGIRRAHELTSPAYRLPSPSATFHGRDIFAPAAAHLAGGLDPAELGSGVDDLVRLPEPEVTVRSGLLRAQVLTVDGFGNVSLAATTEQLHTAGLSGRVRVRCDGASLMATTGRTFADVAAGEPVLYTDSSARPTVAINGGSAAAALGVTSGETTCEITRDRDEEETAR